MNLTCPAMDSPIESSVRADAAGRDLAGLLTALSTRSKARQAFLIEQALDSPSPALEATIIICTYRRSGRLAQCLESACRQRFDHARYEIIVVNNDPSTDLESFLAEYRTKWFADHPGHLRLTLAPIKGLSCARNAGISVARGAVVAFLDDDALADPSWLAQLLAPYQADRMLGVVGGAIYLKDPEPRPFWLTKEAYKYWSQFVPAHHDFYACDDWRDFPYGANWSARREALIRVGGFRNRYGRHGHDAGMGEEIVCALTIKRLGYKVGIQPQAQVCHDVDPKRFTLFNLWQTIQASWMNPLQMEQDQYIAPRAKRWVDYAWHGVRRVAMALFLPGGAFIRLEHLFSGIAAWHAGWEHLKLKAKCKAAGVG